MKGLHVVTDNDIVDLINDKATRYDRVRRELKKLELRKGLIREDLLDLLGRKKELQTERWKVNRIKYGRRWVNLEALAEAIDLEPFTEKVPVEQLRVTAIGG